MDEINFQINQQPVVGKSGQSVLEVARENGMEIPALCYHPHLSVAGSCRLCAVEVDGRPGVQMACTLQPSEGMAVTTESAQVSNVRKSVLELLLSKFYNAGLSESETYTTEFEKWVTRYGVEKPPWGIDSPWTEADSDPNPVVYVDMNKCILCTRCVRVCSEVQGSFVWGVSERGADAKIVAGADMPMLEAGCESCGLCVQVCPTGALFDRMSVGKDLPEKIVRTTCTYCGVGCQLSLHVKDNQITRVTIEEDVPPNGISLCVKGRYGYTFVNHEDRLTRPMVRQYLLEGEGTRKKNEDRGDWVAVDWDTATQIVARKFSKIRRESGGDAIGVLASAKCTNEENYIYQKFARQVIGTHNVDHCARL
jgi:predicted molibdopterin-dependent oxidoreductase YjgC